MADDETIALGCLAPQKCSDCINYNSECGWLPKAPDGQKANVCYRVGQGFSWDK